MKIKWPEMVARVAHGEDLGDPWWEHKHHPGNKRRWFIEGDLAIGVWGFEIMIGYASRLDGRKLPKLKATQILTQQGLTLYRETLTPKGDKWWFVYTDELPFDDDFIRFYASAMNENLPPYEVTRITNDGSFMVGNYDDKWGSGKGLDKHGEFVFVRVNQKDHKVYNQEENP